MAFISSGPLRETIIQILVYALGLFISPSPLLFVTILCTGIIHLILLPTIWPPSVLHATEAQIEEIETLLHDECARRRNAAMANIYARGLARLDVFRAEVDRLSHQHCTLFHFCSVHRYVRIVYKLSRDSQRCLRDVKDHRIDLEQKIRALDRAGFPAQHEANAGPATLQESPHAATDSVIV